MQQILILRSGGINIGDTLIERGAKAMISRAFPDANIVEASAYGQSISARRSFQSPLNIIDDVKSKVKNIPVAGSYAQSVYNVYSQDSIRSSSDEPDYAQKWAPSENFRHAAEFIDCDLAVLPGCQLGNGIPRHAPAINSLRKKGVPLIILGGGSGNYSNKSVSYTRKQLKEWSLHGLIARDEACLDAYSDCAKRSRLGLDCGLFINDWYTPPESSEEFSVATFDKIKEPEIDVEHMIIRPHHSPYNNPGLGYSNRLAALPNSSYSEPIHSSYFEKENISLSDSLKDYLFLYANADQTHSDRIHACIPALAYNNKAQFYFETSRSGLFNEIKNRDILNGDIRDGLVTLDQETLEAEKEKEIDKLRDIVSDL